MKLTKSQKIIYSKLTKEIQNFIPGIKKTVNEIEQDNSRGGKFSPVIGNRKEEMILMIMRCIFGEDAICNLHNAIPGIDMLLKFNFSGKTYTRPISIKTNIQEKTGKPSQPRIILNSLQNIGKCYDILYMFNRGEHKISPEKQGIFYIPKQVQQEVCIKLGEENYIDASETIARIKRPACYKLINHKHTLYIPINFKPSNRSKNILFDLFDNKFKHLFSNRKAKQFQKKLLECV